MRRVGVSGGGGEGVGWWEDWLGGGGWGLVGELAGMVTRLALCSESEPAVGPVSLSGLKVWC